MTTALIDTPPAVLAPALEAHARRYIQARTRSGDALLEAVAALADARAAAAHGEWGIFLAAVGLDDSRARALIRLHDECRRDAALADRVRSGWLSEAAARELLPAPAEVRAAVLDAAAPPTLADVREAKRAAGGQTAGLASADDTYVSKVRALLEGLEVWHDSIRPDVIRDARKQAAEVRNDALRAALLAEIAQAERAATPDLPSPPAPDLADILLRLDAHGYNRIGERQKGMTMFYRFLNYGSGDEHEYAAGELPYLLADLDASAARAEARRAAYEDARQRFAALGYDLRRDAGAFSLYQPGGELHSTTKQLDPQLKTLATFEAGALKRAAERTQAAAPTPHLPDGWAEATARANRLGLYLGMNMAGVFSLSNLSGSVANQIESWPDVLALLELKEAAATRAAPAAKAADWNAIAQASYKLSKTIEGWATDPQTFLAHYRAIGMLLAAGGVLPALPTRPRPPRSADVSDQLAYLGQLETYVEALERRAGVRP